jgi:formylglycine-generating enzyme required for sulfatase activity
MVGLLAVGLAGCFGGGGEPAPEAPKQAAEAAVAEVVADAPSQLVKLPEGALLCPADGEVVPACFAPVPAGSFKRGAQAVDPNGAGYDPLARPDQGPPRDETVAAFWMMSSEATVGQYDICMHAGKCSAWSGSDPASDPAAFRGAALAPPVRYITWAQANELCTYLGGRLPTEVEWEYAARGGENRRFSWGDTTTCPYYTSDDEHQAVPGRDEALTACGEVLKGALAKMTGQQADVTGAAVDLWGIEGTKKHCATLAGKSAEVAAQETFAAAMAALRAHPGSRACDRAAVVANTRPEHHPFGMRAMSTNVAEWTSDVWRPTLDGAPGPDSTRAVRGGSFESPEAAGWLVAFRQPRDATKGFSDVGVRCVRDAAPATVADVRATDPSKVPSSVAGVEPFPPVVSPPPPVDAGPVPAGPPGGAPAGAPPAPPAGAPAVTPAPAPAPAVAPAVAPAPAVTPAPPTP